ncbi:hypothetical protein ACVIEM_005975 [Rhizobium leguminosarum]
MQVKRENAGVSGGSGVKAEKPKKFELEGYQDPVSLLIHARFSTTTVAQELQTWPAAMLRLREQLLTMILVHVALHAMRPGTLRFQRSRFPVRVRFGKQAGAAWADQGPDRVRDFFKRQVPDLNRPGIVPPLGLLSGVLEEDTGQTWGSC